MKERRRRAPEPAQQTRSGNMHLCLLMLQPAMRPSGGTSP